MTLEFADPALSGGPLVRQRDRYFSVHYLSILRYCVRQLSDHNDAEDATQETFRRAIQQGIGEVDDPLPWLLTVARNVCVDELRRRRSGRSASERMVAVQGTEEPAKKQHGNPEHIVLGRMFVGELLGRLTPAERRVVAGRVLEGESGGEAAAAMGVTQSTTRVLLARARGKLRQYLTDEHGLPALAGLAGWRVVDRLRRRNPFSSWVLQGPAQLLLPALVISGLTALSGTPGAAGGGGPAITSLPPALVAERLDVARSVASNPGASTHAGQLLEVPSPPPGVAAPAPTSPRPPGAPLASLFPAADPNQVAVTDFEPSPDYNSDHTVLMLGWGNCFVRCSQLFRSSDGGATWTYVPSEALHSSQLLVPQANRTLHHFYAAGQGMLQVTDNGGASFRNVFPLTGITAVAPAWLSAQLVEADVALSFIGASQVPQVAAVYGPADAAAGAPLLLPAPGGYTALQVVQNGVLGGPDTLLRCTATGCASSAQLPLSGPVQLIASPAFDSDHSIVAFGDGVAVSHDAGATFQLASNEPVSEATFVPGPGGQRLVGIDHVGTARSQSVLVFSDDLGQTWQRAAVDPARVATDAHSPRLLRSGRIIAWAGDAGHNVFVCSGDGARWSSCAADRG
jgi:RNA polymerase sigma-70 factor (ECF subfamily)